MLKRLIFALGGWYKGVMASSDTLAQLLGSRSSRGIIGKVAVAVLMLALGGWLASCSGGSSTDPTTIPSSSTSSSTSSPATTTTAPQTLVEQYGAIDPSQLGEVELDDQLDPPDYVVRDNFDRCELYSPDLLNKLLTRRFEITITQAGSQAARGACFWRGTHTGGADVRVEVRLAKLSPAELADEESIDPTMGDFIAEVGVFWADHFVGTDIVWELTASSLGPGVAFKSGSIIGQANVLIEDPQEVGRERDAEILLVQNMALRLPQPPVGSGAEPPVGSGAEPPADSSTAPPTDG